MSRLSFVQIAPKGHLYWRHRRRCTDFLTVGIMLGRTANLATARELMMIDSLALTKAFLLFVPMAIIYLIKQSKYHVSQK